jgi:hypothetical protein
MNEYSDEERKLLLRLAHRAIAAELHQEKLDTSPPSTHLAEPRGAFTTLHRSGELRGCIGYIIPLYPLYRTIADTAAAAAFRDPRFAPVTVGELAELEIEISVLSLLVPIEPEEVEVGRHGLMVTFEQARGAGTGRNSSRRPAAKPACRRMRGSTVPAWKPLRLRYLARASRVNPSPTAASGSKSSAFSAHSPA